MRSRARKQIVGFARTRSLRLGCALFAAGTVSQQVALGCRQTTGGGRCQDSMRAGARFAARSPLLAGGRSSIQSRWYFAKDWAAIREVGFSVAHVDFGSEAGCLDFARFLPDYDIWSGGAAAWIRRLFCFCGIAWSKPCGILLADDVAQASSSGGLSGRIRVVI